MSVEAVTNPDTGERFYRIAEATPPRKMWSLTTLLGCGSSKALIYHAGVQGMQRTLDLAARFGATLCGVPRQWTEAEVREGIEVLCSDAFGRTKEGFIRPPHLLEWGKKADTGSAVHNAIEREIKLRLGLVAPAEYDLSAFTDAQKAGYAKACAAWDEWKLKAHFEPLASEEVVWVEGLKDTALERVSVDSACLFDYACRVDLAATILGERGIWDVKTGKMDKNGQPYDSMWLQVEAQRRAANARDLCGGGFTVAGIIHVPAAGGPVVVHSNALRDKDRDFQAFDHLNGYARLSVLGDPGVL